MAESLAFLAVAGLSVSTPARRDGGQRRIPVTAAAAIDPTDGDVARAAALRPRSPEERLCMAVLVQALWEVRRYHPASREGAEVRHWIASDDQSWPFAFCALCDVLGLDPAIVRARVGAEPSRGLRRPQLRAVTR
jgi:hypothetical protein